MGPGEFLNINFFTALFTLFNTIGLFWALKRILFQPVMNMITARQKEIDALYADAGAAKENAQTLEAAYKDRLDSASETGRQIVREAVARAESREAEILRQANADAAAMMDKAAAAIAREKKKAINEAKDEIAGIAIMIAEKVVARQIQTSDQGQLVDAFISGLGDLA